MFLNRSYSQMDVLVKASITLQIIEDVAIYKAQIFSSNGNIFGTSDKTSDIHLTVWKGLEDITSGFTDIVWRRFTSHESGYEEDLIWGEQHYGKTSFVLDRNDILERAKLQVEVYANINGIRTLAAVDYINFIDVNDLSGSTVPPINPKHGDLWLDISVTPPRLMMWDDNLKMWVEVAVAGSERRNLVRNSNFYKATFDHWTIVGNPVLEIESMSAKKWARLKSETTTSDLKGIAQDIKNIQAKSTYTFQMLSQVYSQSNSPDGDALIVFYSIDKDNNKTILKEEVVDLTSALKIHTIGFSTIESSESLQIIISGNKSKTFDFVFTNIKIENYAVATDWELAIEDIQDALDNKLGNSHDEVFNSLTDNGKMQGMYTDVDENNVKNFYFNASYIKTGKLLGEYIEAKNLLVEDEYKTKTLEIDSKGRVSIRATSLQITGASGIEDVATTEDISYKVEIKSTNGFTFTNGNVETELIAMVYKGKENITDSLEAIKFNWVKTLADGSLDEVWNNTVGKGKKIISVNRSDINKKSTFSCNILK